MKGVRWILSFLGVCIVAFAAGIVTGFIKNEVKNNEIPETEPIFESARAVIYEEETLPHKESEFLHYLVQCNGNFVVLEKVFTDGKCEVVESYAINTSVLPKADIALLEEGMSFTEKEEALLMIENFVS